MFRLIGYLTAIAATGCTLDALAARGTLATAVKPVLQPLPFPHQKSS